MGLIAQGTAATTAVFLLIVCLFPSTLANPAVEIRILFDLGDGTYVWANETVSDPVVTNATWRAVLSAANANDTRLLDSSACTNGTSRTMDGISLPSGFQASSSRKAT